MERVEVLYEDRFGSIIDRAASGFLEIRWFDSTADISQEAFHEWLTNFAEQVGANRRPGVLVDATRFRMPMENMDGAWRDEHIIPRYNAAGVQRFAFLMPDGMPKIGADPEPEGPAQYPTSYFGRRDDALAWLAQE